MKLPDLFLPFLFMVLFFILLLLLYIKPSMVINIPTFYYELGDYNLTNLPIKPSLSVVGNVANLKFCVYSGGKCVPSGHFIEADYLLNQGQLMVSDYKFGK